MEAIDPLPIAAVIALVAVLYSSAGHAGASGYIAVMALSGMAPDTIKPAALTLNVVVASIGAIQFWRAGHFSWRLFWPFAVISVPAAFAGGYVALPGEWLQRLIGLVLLFSATRLFVQRRDPDEVREPHGVVALAVGGGLGFLAGITGTGGGIFLTPLLLFCRWAVTRTAAAVSVVFILVNSLSGLCGHVASGRAVPSTIWSMVLAAALGGLVGSTLGSGYLPVPAIRVVLALVLVLAAGKLLTAAV